jgi:uncharacterized protein (DUF1330 family)
MFCTGSVLWLPQVGCLERLSLIGFPSTVEFEGFASDPEYALFADARQRGSVSRFHIVDATDVAGTIPYLRKG